MMKQMKKEYAEPRGTVEETERYTTQHIVDCILDTQLVIILSNVSVHIWLKANA